MAEVDEPAKAPDLKIKAPLPFSRKWLSRIKAASSYLCSSEEMVAIINMAVCTTVSFASQMS